MPKFIDIHSHSHSDSTVTSIRNLNFGEEIPNAGGLFSAGIHPWELDKVNIAEAITWLKEISKSESVVAIGETGLDKAIQTDYSFQTKIFEIQLEIAKLTSKPIIIHSVRSHNEILQLLKIHNFKNPVIFHGFIGHYQIAEQLWHTSIYTSFGLKGLSSSKTKETIKKAPLDKIFIETDNNNLSISDLYIQFAALRGIDLEELKQRIETNFSQIIK